MANYYPRDRKRNTVEHFNVLDIRKVSKNLRDALNIEVTSTACNYGGVRYWWKCPRCGGRCACIYRYGRLWRCRHCLNAVHISSQSTKKDRNIDQMWKTIEQYGLYEKHGVDGFSQLYDFYKPLRMHRKKWARIMEKHNNRQSKNMGDLAKILKGYKPK